MSEYKTVVYDEKTFTFLHFVNLKMLEEAPQIKEELVKLGGIEHQRTSWVQTFKFVCKDKAHVESTIDAIVAVMHVKPSAFPAKEPTK